jgi:hypothetical protein
MRGINVHGVVSRGCNNVVVRVSSGSRTFNVSVRFRKFSEGAITVTTVHRQTRIQGDPWGGMQDEKREFIEQDPSRRLVLKASADAYRSYYSAALRDVRNPADILRHRRVVADIIETENLGEYYFAVRPDGGWSNVLPTLDLSLDLSKLKLLPNAA